MAFAPWDALGGGLFQSKRQLEERKKNGEGLRKMMGSEQNEQQVKISEALTKVAEEHGLESPTTIALAYVMAKTPNVFPIVGGRKVEHLKENIKSLEVKLTDKQIEYLESIVPFNIGFPQDFFGQDPHITGQAAPLLGTVAPIAFVKDSKAIGHE
jgi:aryl-alcohol dehydrogenase-like predicted oxidoreductase